MYRLWRLLTMVWSLMIIRMTKGVILNDFLFVDCRLACSIDYLQPLIDEGGRPMLVIRFKLLKT